MDIKDIKAIIDLMKKNSVSEFELEKQDFKVRLKRGMGGGNGGGIQYEEMPVVAYPASSQIASSATPAAPAVTAIPAPAAASNESDIKSPMIGTFYRSPSPESASWWTPDSRG